MLCTLCFVTWITSGLEAIASRLEAIAISNSKKDSLIDQGGRGMFRHFPQAGQLLSTRSRTRKRQEDASPSPELVMFAKHEYDYQSIVLQQVVTRIPLRLGWRPLLLVLFSKSLSAFSLCCPDQTWVRLSLRQLAAVRRFGAWKPGDWLMQNAP